MRYSNPSIFRIHAPACSSVTSLEGKELTSLATDHLRPSCENAALQVFTQTLLNAFHHKLSDSNPSSQHLDITKCSWQGRVGEIQ